MGMERLLTALEFEKINLIEDEHLDVYIIPMGTTDYSFALLQDLRLNGFSVDMDYMNRKIASNFKVADKLKAKYVIIIGEDEVKNNILTVKDNNTKEEFKIKNSNIIDFLDEKLEECGCRED